MAGVPGGTLWNRMNYAFGAEYGYSMPIAKRLNIDFRSINHQMVTTCGKLQKTEIGGDQQSLRFRQLGFQVVDMLSDKKGGYR